MIDTVTSKKYVTFDSFANISDIFRDVSKEIGKNHSGTYNVNNT